MSRKFICFLLIQILFLSLPLRVSASEINWSRFFDSSVFEKAKKENKFVILDLEAVWCHWCHVMHEKTYANPSLITLLESKFIPVRIDHDLRPDLANEYRDYGWPATIVFNANGEELIKRAGYISPEELKQDLQNIIENPIPEKPEVDQAKIKYSNGHHLSNELKKKLLENYKTSYDSILGGLRSGQKFIDRDSVEYSIVLASKSDRFAKEVATMTLDSALMLIDPVWGGVYQYSTMGGWDYPHFEKLAFIQGEYMRIYSLAYQAFDDKKYLDAALNIYKYLVDFLKDSKGVFYVSQDADLIQGEHSSEYFMLNDFGRRKLGIPRIDKHIYSSQNGFIINSLVYLFNVTNDKKYLNDALVSVDWILKNRKLKFNLVDNLSWIFEDLFDFNLIVNRINWIISNRAFPYIGFSHDKKDLVGPFLNDTLYMGIAFLNLYEATRDKKWLILSERTLRFIDKHFRKPLAGYATSVASCKVCANKAPIALVDENIALARFASSLYKTTKYAEYKDIIEYAMRFLVTPEIATQTITEPGILIADEI